MGTEVDKSRRNALNCKKESVMNFRDFEIARKKIKTAKAHKAIHKKQMERPLSRPRAEKNILAPKNPKLQGI